MQLLQFAQFHVFSFPSSATHTFPREQPGQLVADRARLCTKVKQSKAPPSLHTLSRSNWRCRVTRSPGTEFNQIEQPTSLS